MQKPLFINKNLSDYCANSMKESIRKITEKCNLEKNKPKFGVILDDEFDEKPKFNIVDFLWFLSISSVAIYFYKRLK